MRVRPKTFFRDLWREVNEDQIGNGAAALAYFLMLAVFPAGILALTILPYLPIPNLTQAVMELLHQALPGQAADLFTGIVQEVTSTRRGGLLSLGLLGTLWAASNGIYAIMQQLNVTYDVREGRPFWKARGLSILLLLVFGALIAAAFALIVFGGMLQDWLGTHAHLSVGSWLLIGFAVFRWLVIVFLTMLAFAIMYYVGPDVEQRFRFISPGAIIGTALLIAASIGFRIYVAHFGSYTATYGGLGAAIILLLWLYLAGYVLLLGSEVNALVEHYSARGKQKGEKEQHAEVRRPGRPPGRQPQPHSSDRPEPQA